MPGTVQGRTGDLIGIIHGKLDDRSNPVTRVIPTEMIQMVLVASQQPLLEVVG